MTAPAAVPAGALRCTGCGKVKPEGAFWRRSDGRRRACAACERVAGGLYRRSEAGRAVAAARRDRPEVREARRRRERARARTAARAAAKAAWASSPRGKVVKRRSDTAWLLRSAAAGPRRARLLAVVAACDAELERLEGRAPG